MNKPAILLVLLFMGCATVRPPTGGDKDELAPKLVRSTPSMNELNVNVRRIVLEFNERIQLNSPYKNIVISPPLPTRPDIKLIGSKEMSISIFDELKPNTTYTINLSGVVGDLTENNMASNTSLVFSTGSILDSLNCSGKVLDAYTLNPVSASKVILLPVNDTSDITTEKPYYMAISGEDGSFALNNLKGGLYNCYALIDLNGNSIYDLPKEGLAFMEKPLLIPDTNKLTLLLSVAPPDEQLMMNKTVNTEHGLELQMALPADSVTVRTLDDLGQSSTFIKEHKAHSKNIVFWPSDTTLLKGRKLVIEENGLPLDTITYRPKNKLPFNLSVTLSSVRGNTCFFETSRPITHLDTSKFHWLPDSLGPVSITTSDVIDARSFSIELEQSPQGVIQLLPKAVMAYSASTNDTTNVTLMADDPQSRGSLTVFTDSLDSAFQLIELIDGEGKILQVSQRQDPLNWTDLKPGKYGIKAIADINGNGSWDSGDFETRRQPEVAVLFSEEITVRAGWKLEMDW